MRVDLANLARLAYRRPIEQGEVDRLCKLVQAAQSDGMTLEQAMRVGLEAVLVSPNFLFCIEHDPRPDDRAAVHPVNDLRTGLAAFLLSVEQHAR